MSATKHPKRLVNPTHDIPMRGWFAKQPETGAVIHGENLDEIMKAVQNYRLANGLPVENNLRRQVEIQICDTMSEADAASRCEFLEEDDLLNPPKFRKFSSNAQDLENFGRAVQSVLETASKKGPVNVPPEEATRRANICASCPYNLPIANCWGCGVLGTIYRSISGGRFTTSDSQLRSCDICGCDNKTQVHFTKEVLQLAASKQELAATEFPNWCWKKEALQDV
jgi:hypothetical protein